MLIWRFYLAVPVMFFMFEHINMDHRNMFSCHADAAGEMYSDWQRFVNEACIKERSPSSLAIYRLHKIKKHKPYGWFAICSAPFWANKCCGSNPAALLNHSSIRENPFLCGAFAHLIFTRVLYEGICFAMWEWLLKCVNAVGLVHGGEIF